MSTNTRILVALAVLVLMALWVTNTTVGMVSGEMCTCICDSHAVIQTFVDNQLHSVHNMVHVNTAPRDIKRERLLKYALAACADVL